MEATYRRLWLRAGAAATLLAIVACGTALRFAYYDTPNIQADEPITIEVVRHMRESGDWGVNWAKANAPESFRYNQYNFSSHLYATYFFYRFVKLIPGTADWRSRDNGMEVYRFFAALLASFTLAQAAELGFRLGRMPTAIAAAFLTAVSPLLVQDAHYIRPEAFLTMLALGVTRLSLPGREPQPWNTLMAGFVAGVAVACKVSFLMMVWLPFVPLLGNRGGRGNTLMWCVGITVAIGLGFALGAPGAFMHPEAYFNGVRRLQEQYAGIFLPHGHPDGHPVGDMMIRYFGATLGWSTLAAFPIGIWFLVRRKCWLELLVVAIPPMLFFGFFASQSVFFERNLSHVVPALLAIAAYGIVEGVRTIAGSQEELRLVTTGALLIAMAARPISVSWRLVIVAFSGKEREAHGQFEAATRAAYRGVDFWTEWGFSADILDRLRTHFQSERAPVLLRLTDCADTETARRLNELRLNFDAQVVAVYEGAFPDLPTCTVQTYHSARDWYYLVRGTRSLAAGTGG